MRGVVSLFAGLVFGIGLIVADMTNPVKIQNFLDIFGTWDPSLIFVMGGAIAVTMPAFIYLKKQQKPLFSEDFGWPSRTDLDVKLITGSAIFGLGWGLGGAIGAKIGAGTVIGPQSFVGTDATIGTMGFLREGVRIGARAPCLCK